MNWKLIETNWKLFSDFVKKYWERLTDEQLQRCAGNKNALIRTIHEVYGITHEEIERWLLAWQTQLEQMHYDYGLAK